MGFITLPQPTEWSGAYSFRYSLHEPDDYEIIIFLFEVAG